MRSLYAKHRDADRWMLKVLQVGEAAYCFLLFA